MKKLTKHNETLHKSSLQRKRLIKSLRADGQTVAAIGKKLGISFQRVLQLEKKAK